jgi:hypothetical protein
MFFADVAGFTPMSEALSRSGHYGSEEHDQRSVAALERYMAAAFV